MIPGGMLALGPPRLAGTLPKVACPPHVNIEPIGGWDGVRSVRERKHGMRIMPRAERPDEGAEAAPSLAGASR